MKPITNYKDRLIPYVSALIIIISALIICGAGGIKQKNKTEEGLMESEKTIKEITFIHKELLGRPTDTSVTVNMMTDSDIELFFEYGINPGSYTGKTKVSGFKANEPIETVIAGLKPNSRYYYRMNYRQPGVPDFIARDEHAFHTQRRPGNKFTFTIQADSHLDHRRLCDPKLYKIAIQNALNDNPDFHFDIGDTFRSTHVRNINYKAVEKLYLKQRPYFEIIGRSTPIFLALGNHEAEWGWELDGTPDIPAIWSTIARKLHYPNPFPDEFYSGSEKEEEFVGLRENYYAFEWGDALFMVLDPYWYSTTPPPGAFPTSWAKKKGGKDMWDWTLGEEQYRWFKNTMEESSSKYKFVFSHHVLGETRGAAEWAEFYEWGGKNKRTGEWEFDKMRPGWETPIHPLMVKNKVSVFFQGHDHLFVKQVKDGIIYQECPMPGDYTYSACLETGDCYGPGRPMEYLSGDILGNSGHLRVTVSNSEALVEYVRSVLPKDEEEKGFNNGEVAYSYIVPSK